MRGNSENRRWLVLGLAFLAGGCVPLIVALQILSGSRVVDAEALQLLVWCSFVSLAGVSALICWRILDSFDQAPSWPDAICRVFARIAVPLGAIAVEYEWTRTIAEPSTLNQKAISLGGGFLSLAGLIALVGERAIAHIRPRLELPATTTKHARIDEA